jgi:hypothetical protein
MSEIINEPGVKFNFSVNKKQEEFVTQVLKAVAGQSKARWFFIGGAVRGGKTSGVCATSILLHKMFPGTRSHVVRKTLPALKETVIPSVKKFIPENAVDYWFNSGKPYVQFKNGSQMVFFSENYDRDKDLDNWKGLETNWIFLEQLEELQEATFQKAIERAGSWYGPDPSSPIKIPPPFIFATFNPTERPFIRKIYDDYVAGKLDERFCFITALPTDNPYVTKEQFEAWKKMDNISYRRFVEGDWDAKDTTGLFAYSFNKLKHVDECAVYNKAVPLYLSFDFNYNPITCSVWQHDTLGNVIYQIDEFRLEKSDIYELCTAINNKYPKADFVVTGDATGRAHMAISKGNLTYYDVIRNSLNVSKTNLKTPTVNPSVSTTRVLLNAILDNHPNFKIHPSCKWTISDLAGVKVNETNDIDKRNVEVSHLLDTVRYYLHTFHKSFLKEINNS